MSSPALQLEIERLKAQLSERDAAIRDRDAKIERLAHDLATLEAHVKRLLAGRRGGYLIPEGQGVLFPNALVTDTQEQSPDETAQEDRGDADEDNDQPQPQPEGPKPGTRKGKPRRIDTAGLPCEERTHELPEEERICPDTGQRLVPIGERIFEEIDYQRAQVIVIRHRTVVYGLPPEAAETRQAAPVVTPMPPRPLENCAASAVLLAWLLVQKYANHLPLYRQEAIFARDGLRLPRQTLCDWILRAAEALQPLVDCLMRKIRAGPVMQLDDTPVMCQGGRGEKNFQAYLWTFVNPEVGGVVYRFTSDRTSDLLATELGDFEGRLVGDGYSGNRAAAEKVAGTIVLSGCWAHVIRKFRDAASEAPGTAELFCDDIRKLYEIEREADEAELELKARAVLRQQKSKPILVTIFSRAWRLGGQFSDAGAMAKAIGYLRRQHRPLRRFLEDGRVPIDNNACERAIRPIAIGRRNWLFAGSLRGGRAAAVVYTLIECCKIAKVDMVDYLADVLVRVATHPASRVEDLLPDRWATTVATATQAEPVLV